MRITGELAKLQEKIEGYAAEYGLDFFETRFEMVDYEMMNQLASYDGFPLRYPHWRFGMEYDRMSKSYSYGLHRIYEMVINTDPSYAYLLASNNLVSQKFVMAHVYGHVDFFKNNMWFAHTNRNMLDEMANHATRVRRYIERYGIDTVESFIDACLSIDNLIDVHAVGRPRQLSWVPDDVTPQQVKKIKASDYMDNYINPPEFLEAEQRKLDEAREQQKQFPIRPERDVLLFLQQFGPLENWQRDILGIIREESYYFAPQRQTKIMNEGWASYWHSKIMTEKVLEPNELIDYANNNAGALVMQPGSINPYKIGIELWRHIEDRWNRGAFGTEYENCRDLTERQNWDTQAGLGREKMFEVRRIYHDIGFIDTFLTEEFAIENKMFIFAYNEALQHYEIASREFKKIKKQLLFQLTNFGQPIIEIVDANYKNRGELLLEHRHEGIDLDEPYAQETLANLFKIWRRPVHIQSEERDKGAVLYTYSEKGHKKTRPESLLQRIAAE